MENSKEWENKFDFVVSLEVLEHVNKPHQFLNIAKKHLKTGGLIYFEVPDGESAIQISKNCQEFTIEHIHVFAFDSVRHLIRKCNLNPLKIARIKEVSGKWTIFAFARITEFTEGGVFKKLLLGFLILIVSIFSFQKMIKVFMMHLTKV